MLLYINIKKLNIFLKSKITININKLPAYLTKNASKTISYNMQ